MILQGKVWKYSRDISATDLVPARYDKLGMGRDWEGCASHLIEDIDAEFASRVQKGDLLVVDGTFGMGHAHYYTAGIQGLRTAGIGGVLAKHINGLFFRSSTDLGLKSWRYPELPGMVSTGDELRIDLSTGEAVNLTTGREARFGPVPQLILELFDAGGSANWALRRVGVAA